MPVATVVGVTSGVTGLAGGAAGAVTGIVGAGIAGAVESVFSAAGQWVAEGAVWLLGQVGRALSGSTAVELGSGWFSSHEAAMAVLAATVIVPMACCAALQALWRQSPSMLVRAFLVQLPLALLLTAVAVELVQMALAATDAASARILSGAGVDTTNLLAPVSSFLLGTGLVVPAVPAFVVFVGGLLVALATLCLWLELVVRAAAVSVAVLFLPLALAALVWPAVSHWCRRLADTIAALVLSKLVIAAVLALAIGAVAGGTGADGSDGGGFASVVTGIALLIVATAAPFTLLRLIPAVEAGAIAHLEGTRHRLTAAAKAPVAAGNFALQLLNGKDDTVERAAGIVGTDARTGGAAAGAAGAARVAVGADGSGAGGAGGADGSGAAGAGGADGRPRTTAGTTGRMHPGSDLRDLGGEFYTSGPEPASRSPVRRRDPSPRAEPDDRPGRG